MNREEVISSVRTMVVDGQDGMDIRSLVNRASMPDLAEAVASLAIDEGARFWRMLPVSLRPELFAHLDAEVQDGMLERLPRPDLVSLFVNLPADERADIYKRMDEASREKLMPALAKVERDDILGLAAFDEGTVGSITTSDYATTREDMRVGDALRDLRAGAPNKETIYVVYVLDEQRRLVGTVSLRELLLAPDAACVVDLMRRDPVCVPADQPQEQAAKLIDRYDLLAIPVVDESQRMIGIVTVDDAMDVSQLETTEDFHKTSGMSAPAGMSVRSASVWQLYRKRVLWLVILVFGNLFSGAGLAHFEELIASYIALVFFLPLLIDSSGNAGSQSATLMVRALATGDVEMKDWVRMLGREFLTAALLGVTMAVAVSGIGVARGGTDIAIVVAMSMVLVVIMGSLIGMSLPFILTRMKLDPATASAPLITSISDVAGILIYLSIAVTVLGMPAG